MVFFPAVLVVVAWISSTFLAVSAVYPSSGPVVWSAAATTAVVAECYPLSVQFTSTVAPQNISFFYYVGVQSEAGQTVIPFGSWPQSQWVDASTVFTASSQSVPVAAGSMIALRVMGYDNEPSYLLEITVQPNTDASCITSASQQGAADYNHYPRESATTTVSPLTLASSGGGGAPSNTDGASPSITGAGSNPPTGASVASSSPSSTQSSSASAQSSHASESGTSASSLTSQSTAAGASSLTPVAANAPPSTGTSSPDGLPAATTSSKHSATAIIVGALIAALATLAIATGTILWFVRRRNRRRMTEARNRAAAPYDVAPPPIREVDAGRFDPERLPPQYEDIPGSDLSGQQNSNPNSRTDREKIARPHPNLNYL